MTSLSFGAESGRLLLRTGVEGRLARLGHRMTIELTDWTARIELKDELPVRAELTVKLSGFEVRKAEGGVTPLTRADRALVKSNAMRVLMAKSFPDAGFAARQITRVESGFEVSGSARIAGVSREMTVNVAVSEEESTWLLSGLTSIDHSDFGLRPYAQMLGGLRVSDRVDVEFEAEVPKPES
ncbi:MAG: YceI family protein [Candidatus Nanopelagicales bacterium]|nr:YceI family protein [Candidatus Nanopelagicales bacterium]